MSDGALLLESSQKLDRPRPSGLLEELLDLFRLGQRGILLLLHHAVFRDDVETDVYALIADEDGRASNELLDLALTLVAKGAPQCLIAAVFLRHPISASSGG